MWEHVSGGTVDDVVGTPVLPQPLLATIPGAHVMRLRDSMLLAQRLPRSEAEFGPNHLSPVGELVKVEMRLLKLPPHFITLRFPLLKDNPGRGLRCVPKEARFLKI